MRVRKLILRNFRNYQYCDLDLAPNLNILVGRNAQGKTNLLESLHFLSTGRSHRTSSQQDLIRWGAAGFFLQAIIEKSSHKITIEFIYEKDRQRQLRLNGIPQRKLSALLGVFNSVLFTPEDLLLLKGPPALRRRFLDMELSQISSIYLYTLQQYNRVLLQRNQLLRSFSNRQADKDALAPWTKQLIKYGTRLTLWRQRALDSLQKFARPHLEQISGGNEEMRLIYHPWGRKLLLESNEETEIAALLSTMLEQLQESELRRRLTLAGPHRDNFVCLINDIDVKEFGSQGQQRSAVLAIKMSEIDFMHETTGEYPILLLDDVLSELDSHRRQALLTLIDRGIQTIVTGTEVGLFTGWQGKSLLVAEVANGIIDIVR